MKRFLVVTAVLAIPAVLAAQGTAPATPAAPAAPAPQVVAPPPPPPPVDNNPGVQAFLDVARVLQSPRCANCHPNGDVPTQGDQFKPHAMNISRNIDRLGMSCQSCHRTTGTVATEQGMPPAVAGWGLPPKETPMVFQGKTAHDLCVQLKDPSQNGGRDFSALEEHLHTDLVTWAWKPGPGRSVPPMAYADFLARFKVWTDAGGPCP